jgi:hypothetical protein
LDGQGDRHLVRYKHGKTIYLSLLESPGMVFFYFRKHRIIEARELILPTETDKGTGTLSDISMGKLYI